jgi:hypothetical protein
VSSLEAGAETAPERETMSTTTTLIEATPPANTPWGPAEDRRWAGVDGLYAVTTASHGGYWLTEPLVTGMQITFPGFQPFAGWPWLEEDCDAMLVMALWPELFPDHAVWSGWRMALSGATWCNAARAIREWLESTDAGMAWAQRCAAWGRAHGDYWVAGGAYGDSTGWRVDWRRVRDGKTVTIRHGDAYPTERIVAPGTIGRWIDAGR